MNETELLEGIYRVDESLLREPGALRLSHRRRRILPQAAIFAAAAVLLGLVVFLLIRNVNGFSTASQQRKPVWKKTIHREADVKYPVYSRSFTATEDEAGNYWLFERVVFPEQVQNFLDGRVSELEFSFPEDEFVYTAEEEQLISETRRRFRLTGFNPGELNIEFNSDSVALFGDLAPLLEDRSEISVLVSHNGEVLVRLDLEITYIHIRDEFSEAELSTDGEPYIRQAMAYYPSTDSKNGGGSFSHPGSYMKELEESNDPERQALFESDNLLFYAVAPEGCVLLYDRCEEGVQLDGSKEQVIVFTEADQPDTVFTIRMSSERLMFDADLTENSRIWDTDGWGKYTFSIFVKDNSDEVRRIDIDYYVTDEPERFDETPWEQ